MTAAGLLSAGRACYGLVLLAVPARVIGVTGALPSQQSCRVARVLGVRHLVQAAASARADRGGLAAGAAVDSAHAVSMLVMAVVLPRLRRAELADGGITVLLAALGLAVRFGPSAGT